MAQLSPEQFEALWQDAQKGPVVREAAVQAIQLDLSLSAGPDRYVEVADGYLAQGKIAQTDHVSLMAAIGALKAVLTAINERDLAAQTVADSAKVVQQQLQERISSLTASLGKPT